MPSTQSQRSGSGVSYSAADQAEELVGVPVLPQEPPPMAIPGSTYVPPTQEPLAYEQPGGYATEPAGGNDTYYATSPEGQTYTAQGAPEGNAYSLTPYDSGQPPPSGQVGYQEQAPRFQPGALMGDAPYPGVEQGPPPIPFGDQRPPQQQGQAIGYGQYGNQRTPAGETFGGRYSDRGEFPGGVSVSSIPGEGGYPRSAGNNPPPYTPPLPDIGNWYDPIVDGIGFAIDSAVPAVGAEETGRPRGINEDDYANTTWDAAQRLVTEPGMYEPRYSGAGQYADQAPEQPNILQQGVDWLTEPVYGSDVMDQVKNAGQWLTEPVPGTEDWNLMPGGDDLTGPTFETGEMFDPNASSAALQQTQDTVTGDRGYGTLPPTLTANPSLGYEPQVGNPLPAAQALLEQATAEPYDPREAWADVENPIFTRRTGSIEGLGPALGEAVRDATAPAATPGTRMPTPDVAGREFIPGESLMDQPRTMRLGPDGNVTTSVAEVPTRRKAADPEIQALIEQGYSPSLPVTADAEGNPVTDTEADIVTDFSMVSANSKGELNPSPVRVFPEDMLALNQKGYVSGVMWQTDIDKLVTAGIITPEDGAKFLDKTIVAPPEWAAAMGWTTAASGEPVVYEEVPLTAETYTGGDSGSDSNGYTRRSSSSGGGGGGGYSRRSYGSSGGGYGGGRGGGAGYPAGNGAFDLSGIPADFGGGDFLAGMRANPMFANFFSTFDSDWPMGGGEASTSTGTTALRSRRRRSRRRGSTTSLRGSGNTSSGNQAMAGNLDRVKELRDR